MLVFKSYLIVIAMLLLQYFVKETDAHVSNPYFNREDDGQNEAEEPVTEDAADDIQQEDTKEELQVTERQESEDREENLDKNEENNEQLLGHLADVVDLRHIEKHLRMSKSEQLAKDDIEAIREGDEAKGIFYFFELHDFDDNSKLDGLELYHALTDYHKKVNEKIAEESEKKQLSEAGAIAIIDNLLLKHDLDNDGHVDFMELMNSNPDSLWNRLSSKD